MKKLTTARNIALLGLALAAAHPQPAHAYTYSYFCVSNGTCAVCWSHATYDNGSSCSFYDNGCTGRHIQDCQE